MAYSKKVQGHRQTFEDHAAQRKRKIASRKAAAKKANSSGKWKKDISKYDYSGAWSKQFDTTDLKRLKKAGYNDKQIRGFLNSLSEDQIQEGVRRNHRNVAGKHSIAQMKKGSKITDYDSGSNFGMADVRSLRSQGFSDKEIAKYARTQVSAGKGHGNPMSKFMADQGYLDYDHGSWKNAKSKAQAQKAKPKPTNNVTVDNKTPNNSQKQSDVTTPGFPDPQPGKNPYVSNKQEQNVQQDNDITTTINGDNNKVFNEQDNSIRQYGGDNRSLVIGGGPDAGRNSRGKYYTDADKAITMGTLGGFYAPDNSPAAQAKFTDLNQTLNRDAQKKYSNVGVTTAEKYAGFRGGDTNIQGLQKRIDQNDQYFRDLSTLQEVKTYGDRAAKTKYPKFEFGAPIEEVKSNAGSIASGYKSSINNM